MKIKDAADLTSAIYELRYRPTCTVDGTRFPPIPATLDQITEAADALRRTRRSTLAGLPITVARETIKWAIAALTVETEEFVIAAESPSQGQTSEPAPAPTRSPADEPMNSDDQPQLPDDMLLAMLSVTTARIESRLQAIIDHELANLDDLAEVHIRRALSRRLAASADTRLYLVVRDGTVTQAKAARSLGLTRARVSQIVGHQQAEAARLGLA